MITLGNTIADWVRKWTKAGKDVYGNRFKAYSAKYANRKAAGKAGELTKKGKGRRQSSNSTRPNLTLTGDMLGGLQSLQGKGKAGSVIVGFSTGEQDEKAIWNEDNGRFMSTEDKPLNASAQRAAVKVFGDTFDKQLKKTGGKTVIG